MIDYFTVMKVLHLSMDMMDYATNNKHKHGIKQRDQILTKMYISKQHLFTAVLCIVDTS